MVPCSSFDKWRQRVVFGAIVCSRGISSSNDEVVLIDQGLLHALVLQRMVCVSQGRCSRSDGGIASHLRISADPVSGGVGVVGNRNGQGHPSEKCEAGPLTGRRKNIHQANVLKRSCRGGRCWRRLCVALRCRHFRCRGGADRWICLSDSSADAECVARWILGFSARWL